MAGWVCLRGFGRALSGPGCAGDQCPAALQRLDSGQNRRIGLRVASDEPATDPAALQPGEGRAAVPSQPTPPRRPAMKRRTLLATGLAAGAAALAAPRIGNAQAAKPLRFVPDADLALLDPVVTTSYQTRDHGFMVWDTLYGQDSDYAIRPQMVDGHVVEDNGLTWKLTLREGL